MPTVERLEVECNLCRFNRSIAEIRYCQQCCCHVCCNPICVEAHNSGLCKPLPTAAISGGG